MVKNQNVLCSVHVATIPAIACKHLRTAGAFPSEYIGWIQAEFDPENIEPGSFWAWCFKCHEIYESQGGWTESSEVHADFRVVCQTCFVAFREAQERLRSKPG
jgi:hypothetical protein